MPTSTAMRQTRGWRRSAMATRIVHQGGRAHRLVRWRGRLWFCGRKSQRVVVDAVHPRCAPSKSNRCSTRIRRGGSALVGVNSAQRPVLCVELRPGADSANGQHRAGIAAHGRWLGAYRRCEAPRHPKSHSRSISATTPRSAAEKPAAWQQRPRRTTYEDSGDGRRWFSAALCRGAGRARHDVTPFQSRPLPGADAIGAKQIAGDLADRDAVMAAFAGGFDAVFHNAAKAGAWGSYDSYHRANVVGTQNVLRPAARTRHRQAGLHLHAQRHPSRDPSGRRRHRRDRALFGEHFQAPYATTRPSPRKRCWRPTMPACDRRLRPRLIWGPGDKPILPRLVERAKAGPLRTSAAVATRSTPPSSTNAQAHFDAFDHPPWRGLRGPFTSSATPPWSMRDAQRRVGAAGALKCTSTCRSSVAYAVGGCAKVCGRCCRCRASCR